MHVHYIQNLQHATEANSIMFEGRNFYIHYYIYSGIL